MNYRKLGATGLKISELSLGSWVTFHNQFGVNAAIELMAEAYDSGVNFFDNAQAYASGQSEQIMGAALKKLGWRRGSYLVSTKLYWGLHDGPNERNTLNRKFLIEGIDGCLQRLQLEHVDLLYCHRPDPDTPIEETVWAMHNIIERGKALYWGTSEWSASEITQAIKIAESHHLHKPVVEQPIYNMFNRHRFADDYVALYDETGFGATTWSPLASGLLSGKYLHGVPDNSRATVDGMEWLQKDLADQHKIRAVEQLQSMADSVGATLAQFSIAWCLQNRHVSSVITGASHVGQLRENLGAERFVDSFSGEMMRKIDQVFSAEK